MAIKDTSVDSRTLWDQLAASVTGRRSWCIALVIVLISIAVVLVLCVGGSTAFYLAARNTVNDVTDAAETAYPTPAVTPSATPSTRTPTRRSRARCSPSAS